MRKIIIFGATGTIGAYTCLLLKKHYSIIAVGKRKSDNGFFKENGIEYYSVDISKKEEFDKLPKEQVSAVLHLAGAMPANMKDYNPQIYIDSILTGTLNVLDYTIKYGSSKLIFTQSRADSAYLMGTTIPIKADIEKKYPLNTDHTVYTIAKNAAVDLIEHYYYKENLKRFVFRLPTIYAYHPNKFFYVDGVKKEMAYRQIIEKALHGKDIEIWGDSTKAKEICYINDLIQCFHLSIEAEINGGVYNFGRGVGVTIEEQIKGIVDVFSPKNNISKITYKPNKPDSRQFVHDISKTVEELNYSSEYDYKSLLKEFKKEMEFNRFELLWGKNEDYE